MQYVTVLNTIGNCNTIVIMYLKIYKHEKKKRRNMPLPREHNNILIADPKEMEICEVHDK